MVCCAVHESLSAAVNAVVFTKLVKFFAPKKIGGEQENKQKLLFAETEATEAEAKPLRKQPRRRRLPIQPQIKSIFYQLLLLAAVIAGAGVIGYFLKGALLFLLLLVITATTVYVINRFSSPFDISPLFFATVAVMHFYGLKYAVIFVFLASVIPSLMAGSVINVVGFASLSFVLLIAYFGTATAGFGQQAGVLLSLVYSAVAFAIIQLTTGDFGKAASSLAVLAVINALYFIVLTELVLQLGNALVA